MYGKCEVKIFHVNSEMVYCSSEEKIGWVVNVKFPPNAPQYSSSSQDNAGCAILGVRVFI